MTPKHVLYLLIFISCTLAACHPSADEGVKAKLTQAEDMMYAAPDSALQLLEHLQPPKEKEQRATWALLLAQARYRNNVKQSDSLANVAYDFFKKTDNAERKALALYLKGGVIEESGDVDEAQKYYLQAKDEVEKMEDYQLGFLIHAHLGNLYAFQGIKEHAFTYYKKAYRYAELSKNSNYIISSLMYFGRVYSMPSPDYKKSIYYYKQALELAQMNQNWRKFDTVIWELIGIFEFIDDFQTAYTYAQMGLHSPYRKGEQPDERLSMILGHIYSKLGKVDSAYSYLSKATTSNIPEIKRSAYNYLYNLERRQGNYREALDACEQCLIYNDSVYLTQKADELIEMQAKYDQQKVIIERNELQLKKEHMTRNYLFISIIIAIIGGIIIGMYQRALVKKEKLLKKQEDAMQQAKLRMNENEFIIERNKQKIAELDLQIKASNEIKELLEEERTAQKELQQQNQSLIDENVLLQRKMEQYSLANEAHSNTLQELNKLIIRNKYLHERELFLSECLVKTNPILNRVKTKHAYIEDIQWKQLKEELNLIFDNYIERLLKLAPSISERELHLSCLIKLKMSNIDMGDALGISPSSVAKLKQRLKDRLSTEIPSFDKSMLLDVWLWDF